MTRTLSPAFRRLWPSTPSDSISFWGMTASVFVPTSTMTPSGEAPMTAPVMISPRRRLPGWAASVSSNAAMSISAGSDGAADWTASGAFASGAFASGAGGAGGGAAAAGATAAGGDSSVAAPGACSSMDTGGLRLTALPVCREARRRPGCFSPDCSSAAIKTRGAFPPPARGGANGEGSGSPAAAYFPTR